MSKQNTGDFFVMLTIQNGGYTPLMLSTNIAYNESELAKFETRQAAKEGALSSVLGEQFGYEIFEIGSGES